MRKTVPTGVGPVDPASEAGSPDPSGNARGEAPALWAEGPRRRWGARRRLPFLVLRWLAMLMTSSVSWEARGAEPVEVRAEVSGRVVTVGDVVSLDVVATSHVEGAIDVEIPEVDGLTETSRSQGESTSISWTGRGQVVNREQRISIELTAERPGKFVIGPISARSGGVSAKSQPITIEVRGDSAAERPRPHDATTIPPPDEEERHIFLRYRVDKGEAHLGEQILLDLEIYADARANFGVEELPPPPSLDGFWREIVDQPQQLRRRSVTIGSRRYDAYRAWRVAIFPLEAGLRTIPSAHAVFSQNRTIFERGTRIRRRSPAIAIAVKDLPSEGRPPDFRTTNVGAYELTATVDQTNVPAGKGAILKISLSGRGNIKSARLPEITKIDGFRVFPPAISDRVDVTIDGVSGSKQAEILLVPLRGGSLTIPAFEVSVFDPSRGEYYRSKTNPISVTIEGQPTPPAMSESSAEQENTTASRDEVPALRPLRFRSSLRPRVIGAYRNPTMIGLFFAPPIAYLAFIIAELVHGRLRRQTFASRRRQALVEGERELASAAAAARTGDPTNASELFHRALVEYLSRKVGVPMAGMTIDAVAALLTERGAEADLVGSVKTELEAAEYARFATGLRREDGSSARVRWTRLIRDLAAWEPREV